jgi:hypothetical protein
MVHNVHKRQVTPDTNVQDAGFLSKLATGAGNLFLFAPVLLPLFGGLARGVGYIGEKTGITSVAKAGRNTQSAIKGFGEKSIIELSEGRAYTKNIGDAIQKGANVVGDLTGKVDDSLKISKISELSQYNAKRHLSKISKLAGEATDLPLELKPHLKEIENLAKSRNLDLKKLESSLDGLSKAVSGLQDKTLSSKLTRTVSKIAKLSDKATNSRINANILGDLGGAVRGLPKALGNAPVLSTVMNTGFVATSAMEVRRSYKDFKESLAALHEMESDVKGKAIPASLKEERSKIYKRFAINSLAAVAGLGVSVANIVKGRMSFIGFAAPQIASMVGNAVIGESSLPYYASLKQAHAAGRAIPVEAYAEFIMKVSPDLQARGRTGKVFSKKLAEIYAADNASPATIMQKIADGTFKKDIEGLIADNEAKKSARAIEVVANHEPSTSHVARLQRSSDKTSLHKQEQPIVGPNTAKFVFDAAQASKALNSV